MNTDVKNFINIDGNDAITTDAALTEYVLDNCDTFFTDSSRFFCQTRVNGEMYITYKEVLLKRFANEFAPYKDETYDQIIKTNTLEMRFDFGHTSPNWKEIISLGFYGLKKRAEKYEASCSDPKKLRFYSAVVKVYNAAERFIKRVIKKAEAEEKNEIAEGLKNLLVAPPQNMFEAFQMLLLYHNIQHFAEETWIRTFGRVDTLLYPFYINENNEKATELVRDFIKEINGHNMAENQPFALGGSDENGNDLITELSYIFLNEYKKLNPPYVKIHILCTKSTPENFLKCALDSIRCGSNSICFMGDQAMKNALIKLGAEEKDTLDYHVDGCYEAGAYGELTSPATARISIAKAIELALNNGTDVMTGYKYGLPVEKASATFEEFYDEFLRQLENIASLAKKYVGIMERFYPRLHAGLFFTSAHKEYMENGVDVFAGFGAKYNNTSIVGIGLATAVDSLMAVKKLVYDDKTMTLNELGELMKNNWAGNEKLRLKVKNKFPKYGMADAAVDYYAADLAKRLAAMINKQPNEKGGVYRLGLHSINVRWLMGSTLAATPDGRLAGESTSLNTGASLGADREGITAHIISVTTIDSSDAPNSVTLDLDMHASMVQGENGLNAMYATLKTYLDRGGFSVHYNVLNSDILRAAQKKPEDYPNLQVRVCGWNYLFNNLPKEQQDDYITRFERQ